MFENVFVGVLYFQIQLLQFPVQLCTRRAYTIRIHKLFFLYVVITIFVIEVFKNHLGFSSFTNLYWLIKLFLEITSGTSA